MISDKQKPYLKTSLLGYNKNDVLAYISEMSAEYNSELIALKDENSSLKERCNELELSLSSANEIIASYKNTEEEALTLQKKLDEALAEVEIIKAGIEEKYTFLTSLTNDYENYKRLIVNTSDNIFMLKEELERKILKI